jgi:hypothetical protein
MQKIRVFSLLEVFCRVHPLGTTKNAVLGWIIRVVLQGKQMQYKRLSQSGIGQKNARTTKDDPDPMVRICGYRSASVPYQNVTDPEHYINPLINRFVALGGQQRSGTGLLQKTKVRIRSTEQ